MTPRGLVATAGMGATLLAVLAAPVVTVATVAGVIATLGIAALLGPVQPADERTETGARFRPIHRLLAELTGPL